MSESCPPWAARAAGPAVITCPSSRVVVIASAASTSDGGGAPVPNSPPPPPLSAPLAACASAL